MIEKKRKNVIPGKSPKATFIFNLEMIRMAHHCRPTTSINNRQVEKYKNLQGVQKKHTCFIFISTMTPAKPRTKILHTL